MFDIVSKRFWFYLISGILILIGIVSLTTFGQLRLSVEFQGGYQMSVTFAQPVDQTELERTLTDLGYQNLNIQQETRANLKYFLIRASNLDKTNATDLVTGVEAKLGDLTVQDANVVSSDVASETLSAAAIAVAAAVIAMLLYIAWAFRSMPHPFRYGTAAVIALVHDVFIAIGMFSILSGIFHWDVNLMFVIGVLTVLGYSINSTVIIFDRIRENVRNGASPHIEVIVNNSVVETMGRTMNTNVTVLIGTVALLLFVGATIQNFVVIFLVGALVGVFDSVCVAPMLLVTWERHEWGRFIPFRSRA